ncbi:hypothetical protein WJX77_008481 [Trebouxia sp. C0004]
MVRQEVDSDRLRTLRAELEQKTALLPAVLQTSNCIALVDHLTSVFKDTDWSSAARCLDSLHDAPADSSGWNHFQDLLSEDPDSAQGQAELQAMDMALTEMHANIKGIQASTCLPPSRLAALASISGTGSTNRLETVRCTVCHSLLLNAAFDDHLPNCRPCAIQPTAPARASKSTTSQPSTTGRAASKAAAAKGAKAGKKTGTKGSKKPPAGPSRFAAEQAKVPLQPLPAARQSSDDSELQLPSHPPSHHAQAPAPHVYASMPSSSFPSQHTQSPEGMQLQQAGNHDRRHDATDGKGTESSGSQRAKRSRLVWTYEEHMSRSNQEADAVHDLSLPPRFPLVATRPRTRTARSPSVAAQPQTLSKDGTSLAHTVGRVQSASGCAQLDALSETLRPGIPLSQQPDRHPPRGEDESQATKWQKQASSTQASDTASGTGRQQLQQTRMHGQPRQTLDGMAAAAGLAGHVAPSRQLTSESLGFSHSLHNQHAKQLQVQTDRRSMHGSAAAGLTQVPSEVLQASPWQQPTWNPQQGSSSFQGVHNPHAGLCNPNQASKPKHALGRFVNLPAAHSLHSLDQAASGLSQQPQRAQSRSQQPGSRPAVWPSVNGHASNDDGASLKVAGPGSWRMPESKRQVSVNALARTPFG